MVLLRKQTTVLPNHRIEISAPELVDGTQVEIVITLAAPLTPARGSILEIIESLHGHRLFQTPEEVRRHLA